MKKPLIQKLGLLGLVSFLSYTAAVLLSPRAGKRKHPSPRKRRCPRLQFKPQRPRPSSAPAAASDAWKAEFEKSLFDSYGKRPVKYEDLGNGIYQVYVEHKGRVIPFVTVDSATGDYHG